MPTAASYGSLPFREQVEFFRRKLNVTTQAWTDVLEAEHDVAFMVAGANRDDMVADFREAVTRSIDEGATLAQFRKDFDRIVEKYGWDYNGGRNWRSRVIYETNLRQSYNAGRWTQLQSLKAVRPFWRYRHSDDVQHPRPLHESWDGLVIAADDPWWTTHFPANGWGCKCFVEALNTRDLARLGKNGPDQAPTVQLEPVVVGTRSPGGPRTVMTPAGVDPGFGYAPGRSLTLPPPGASSPGAAPPPPAAEQLQGIVASTAQQVIEKTLRLPAPVAARSAAAVLERPRVLQALAADFAQWQVDLVAGSAGTDTFTAGALAPVVVDAAAAAGIELASVAIAARAAQVEATLQAGALIAEDLALPFQLQAPSAVLLDRAHGVLLFFAPSQRNPGELVEVTVKLADAGAAHTFDGAVVADLQARRRELQSGALQLLDGEL